MIDIVERLRFDAARCEAQFSKGVATNIEEAMAEIERLRAALDEVKAMVVGERDPNWTEDGWRVTATRGWIADICDEALGNTGSVRVSIVKQQKLNEAKP